MKPPRKGQATYRAVQTNGCLACIAKNAEIARLVQEKDAMMARLLDAALPRLGTTTLTPGPEYPPMDEAIELFLDAKFTHGTSRWKQQRREAEKLVAAGKDADFVIETLSRGQAVEF